MQSCQIYVRVIYLVKAMLNVRSSDAAKKSEEDEEVDADRQSPLFEDKFQRKT